LLRRVLQNFLSNAIRYGHQSGRPARVLLGCRRGPNGLRIIVADNGPGIAAEHRQTVFREFTRLRSVGRDGERGLGLGLAIVDRIARVLDHRIALESNPARCGLFHRRAAGADQRGAPAVVAAPTAKSRRFARAPFVVCIDDERQVREGMAALLGSWGCQTALGASAEDVLDSVAQSGRSPDLLLIDLHLGQGQADGLSTITRLRQDWGEDLPAALITAERDPATLNAARGQRVRCAAEAGKARRSCAR
jgi:CheY-like chemotaxis protein/anti-sigma regulatory factor (Ser/Thr protein kinase)